MIEPKKICDYVFVKCLVLQSLGRVYFPNDNYNPPSIKMRLAQSIRIYSRTKYVLFFKKIFSNALYGHLLHCKDNFDKISLVTCGLNASKEY